MERTGYPATIFDRLIDRDLPAEPFYDERELQRRVMRDVNELLNTKRPPEGTFRGLVEVPQSIANFGLADYTHRDGSDNRERQDYARHIESVIAAFEPRLRDVVVFVRSDEDVKREKEMLRDLKDQFRVGALYFRIKATLDVRPEPIEDVTFDTILEKHTGHHTVVPAGGVA